MNKRLKLPNGFGSITKKSGRRRKPFEIRKLDMRLLTNLHLLFFANTIKIHYYLVLVKLLLMNYSAW